MIDYIKGTITQITPAFIIIETGNVGYFINISQFRAIKIFLYISFWETVYFVGNNPSIFISNNT